jgi:hypothetical protein
MNCEKFTRNQSGNILVHCNRSDPNRTYKNQEIDHSKTHLNYNLAPEHKNMTDFEFMKNRCEKLKIMKRKDVNWLVSWVVTIPSDYVGNQQDFFREVYNFMENRYGRENVVSAYVHLDETTPHIHFCFVPVLFDNKKQVFKVNAKKCIDKVELQKIHPQIQEYLENKLQTKVSILNGATAGGNKTISQLKAEEEIKKQAIAELVEVPSSEMKQFVFNQLPDSKKNEIIEDEIEEVKQSLKENPQFIQHCQNIALNENQKLKELETEVSNLTEKKDYLKKSIAELETKHKNQKKELAEEYEKEKQRYNARILEMQNTTIEEEQTKQSFWDKIAERLMKFKLIATISFVSYQFSNGIPLNNILRNVKLFRKEFDLYTKNSEQIDIDLEFFKEQGLDIKDIEKSEELDNYKTKDDYDLEL